MTNMCLANHSDNMDDISNERDEINLNDNLNDNINNNSNHVNDHDSVSIIL